MHIATLLVVCSIFTLAFFLMSIFSKKADNFDVGYFCGATVALCLSAALVGLLT